MTGKVMSNPRDAYLKRLVAPRNIWLNGRKVNNVLQEPAFQGAIDITLSYYDMLEVPDFHFDYKGSPAAISLMVPNTVDDLARKRNAALRI